MAAENRSGTGAPVRAGVLRLVTTACVGGAQTSVMVYRKGSTGARRAGRPAAVWCGLLLAASAHAGQQYDFEVLLDGKPIGRHGFQIDRGPGGIEQVVSTARFDVKILGLTVYRYRHDATERWRDGCLVAIEHPRQSANAVRG